MNDNHETWIDEHILSILRAMWKLGILGQGPDLPPAEYAVFLIDMWIEDAPRTLPEWWSESDRRYAVGRMEEWLREHGYQPEDV